jgi:hypothetical protein
VLSGSEVKYVEKRPNCPVTSFDVRCDVARTRDCLGKVLLAFSPTRITDGLLAKGLTQFTRYTIVAPEKFRHNLATIRQAHVAVSSGELEIGNHGVAMPVFADGKVLAAIEVQVGDPQNDLARVSPALAVACGGLSRELSAVTKGTRNARPAWCSPSLTKSAAPRQGHLRLDPLTIPQRRRWLPSALFSEVVPVSPPNPEHRSRQSPDRALSCVRSILREPEPAPPRVKDAAWPSTALVFFCFCTTQIAVRCYQAQPP